MRWSPGACAWQADPGAAGENPGSVEDPTRAEKGPRIYPLDRVDQVLYPPPTSTGENQTVKAGPPSMSCGGGGGGPVGTNGHTWMVG